MAQALPTLRPTGCMERASDDSPRSLSPSMLSCSLLRPRLVIEENCQLSTSESWPQVTGGGLRKNDRFCKERGRFYSINTQITIWCNIFDSITWNWIGMDLNLGSTKYAELHVGWFLYCLIFLGKQFLHTTAGVGNPWQTCHSWDAEGLSMANRQWCAAHLLMFIYTILQKGLLF